MNSKAVKFIEKMLNSSFANAVIVIIGIIISLVFTFNILDTKPATNDDYKPLFQAQDLIIDDFNRVYNYPNSKVSINDSNIVVTLGNSECSLKIYFDKAKTYLHTEKYDNYDGFIFVFGILFFGLIFASLFWLISIFLLCLLHSFLVWLSNRKSNKYDNITHSGDIKH